MVGFAGTIAVILAAASRLGATPEQLSSWITAVCLAQALAGLVLTLIHRIPIIIAWSTPGAVIAAAPVGTGMPGAVGAFLLYLVTMASQNLPGLAVLRNEGYAVPARSILAVTGLASMLAAPFGGHAVNLGAIVAASCTGPDTHPDPSERWPAGIVFALCFAMVAAFGETIVRLLGAMPMTLVLAVAGLALIGPLTGTLVSAASNAKLRFPAIPTLAVTASGVTFAGIGAPLWGLAAGLAASGLDASTERPRPLP